MAAKRNRRSSFVPRLLVKTAIVGVIPACALGCGSGASTSLPDAAADGDDASDASAFGVAAVAFFGYEAGTTREAGAVDADTGAPGGDADTDAPSGDAGPEPADARPDAFHGFVLAVTAFEVDAPRKG